jgi:hypothetical protein
MLRRLTALRYVTPLREGGSLPAVAETDGGAGGGAGGMRHLRFGSGG